MPRVARWFVRSAMTWLVLGLAGAAIIAGRGALGLPYRVLALDPAMLHLLTVGWLTQMVFGVAFWMFPRYSKDRPRGSELAGWITWGALNAGLALRVVGEPLPADTAGRGSLLLASALLQLIAGLAFVMNTWPRVRATP